QEAETTDVADDWEPAQVVEAGAQARAHLARVLDEAVALDDLQDLEPNRAADGVSAVREAAPPGAGRTGVTQPLVELFLDHGRANREEAGAHPLAEREDVRPDAEVLEGPPLAGAA